jgi:signal transduction histidine kinase
VTNAVQAVEGTGKVLITTTYRKTPRPTWPDTLAKGAVEIRVTDSGPGISTKVLKNLFVPFFTTKAAGTGLGLAISQRIAQNAGGIIDVVSTQGVGSTFTFALPANPASDSLRRPQQTSR